MQRNLANYVADQIKRAPNDIATNRQNNDPTTALNRNSLSVSVSVSVY